MLADIDRAVEIATDHAFASRYENNAPEPEREETCVSCGKQGAYNGNEWLNAETMEVDSDGEGYQWLTGETLYCAADTPMGWVCSDECMSQAMYEKASEYEREALDRVLDACRVLSEYGERACKLVNEKLDGYVPDGLHEGVNEFLKAVGEPKWTNRPTREEKLERAILDAETRLRWMAGIDFGCVAAFRASLPVPISWGDCERAEEFARLAGRAAHIAMDLKEAVEAGVA